MKINDYVTNKLVSLENTYLNVYVCGPTVYDTPHIGNMRAILFMDILAKAGIFIGKSFDLVQNITDIDDKIINKAIDEGISEEELSSKYLKKYMEIIEELNITTITHFPKVTDNIEGIQDLIRSLIDKGFAYESKGNVFFSIDKLKDYGIDFRISQDELEVVNNELLLEKRNPSDFTLWKSTSKGISYDSPWSLGRPGWHTECAHFCNRYFSSETLDIHAGGIDLRFPHHVNEAAQFKALNNKELSKIYFYVGHVTLNGEKMSKSKGNSWKADEFISNNSAASLRWLLTHSSYSKPINVNEDLIMQSNKEISKFKNSLVNFLLKLSKENKKLNTKSRGDFFKENIDLLLNDLDTSAVYTNIYKAIKTLNSTEAIDSIELAQDLIWLFKVLGFKITLDNDLYGKLFHLYKKSDYKEIDEIKEKLVLFK